MPLDRETRWARRYRHPTRKLVRIVSRIEDGSATVTLEEVRSGWGTWAESDRIDFCQGCAWLHGHPDFPDIVRFIIGEASWQECSGIALCVARELPTDEAFSLLDAALERTPLEYRSNVLQALALTRHAEAADRLRVVLAELRRHPSYACDAPFINDLALTATHCVGYLLELGAPPTSLADVVQELSQHACAANRTSCARVLGASFPRLRGPAPG